MILTLKVSNTIKAIVVLPKSSKSSLSSTGVICSGVWAAFGSELRFKEQFRVIRFSLRDVGSLMMARPSDSVINLFNFEINFAFPTLHQHGPLVGKTFAYFLFCCLSCCSWYLANLWFTFGARCFSNRFQITACLVRCSLLSQVQLLYVNPQ